jgi:hypothetical protein
MTSAPLTSVVVVFFCLVCWSKNHLVILNTHCYIFLAVFKSGCFLYLFFYRFGNEEVSDRIMIRREAGFLF